MVCFARLQNAISIGLLSAFHFTSSFSICQGVFAKICKIILIYSAAEFVPIKPQKRARAPQLRIAHCEAKIELALQRQNLVVPQIGAQPRTIVREAYFAVFLRKYFHMPDFTMFLRFCVRFYGIAILNFIRHPQSTSLFLYYP